MRYHGLRGAAQCTRPHGRKRAAPTSAIAPAHFFLVKARMIPYDSRMPRPTIRLAVPVLALLLGACATRSLPKYEKPIARTQVQHVRTTAYTHTESDHVEHVRKYA